MYRFCFMVFLVFVAASVSLAALNVWRWGGPGYDPARSQRISSRFAIYPDDHSPAPELYFQIWVDTKETSRGVNSMVVRRDQEQEISSVSCSKAQLHVNAPYACRFRKADFGRSKEKAAILVFDIKGRELLRGELSQEILKQVL